jgi:hypothetical protein
MKTIIFHGVTYTCTLSERFRRHTPDELDRIRESASEAGICVAIRVYRDATLNLDNCILDGEGRLSTAAELGLARSRVPFYAEPPMTTEEAYAKAKTLNDCRRHDDAESISRRRAERIERVVTARSEGKSLRAIAADEDVSPEQVRQDLKAATVKGLTVETPARVTGLDGKSRPAARPEPEQTFDDEVTDNLPDEVDDEPGGEEDAPPPMTDELPEPSIDAGRRPVPSWMTPGNKVDPNHPFAKLLHKLSSVSADFSKAFKTEQGKILLRALADLANLPFKARFVLFTSDRVEGDEHVAGRAKFVGFHALRDVVKKAGLAKKPLTVKSIRKSFLDALAASDQDMLDSEVWE